MEQFAEPSLLDQIGAEAGLDLCLGSAVAFRPRGMGEIMPVGRLS